MDFIPYGRQDINEDDIKAVVEVLKSDFITQGPVVEQFETLTATYCGAKYAVSCSSGTAALHIAAQVFNIKPGDKVLVPAVTFVASANAFAFEGADVCFVDIDPLTMNISPQKTRDALIKSNASVKLLVTVDLAGHPCDFEAFAELKKQFGFFWVHDACHSMGTTWSDKKGNIFKTGQYDGPDMTVLSFHPVKHITSGEGGMILTHNEKYAKLAQKVRSHGVTKNHKEFESAALAFDSNGELNPWYYESHFPALNYRMSDIHAALGNSQLKRIDRFIKRRREIAALYQQKFANQNHIRLVGEQSSVASSYHLVIALIAFEQLGKSRATVMKKLSARKIGTQVHYMPLPLQTFYKKNNNIEDFPEALKYYNAALSLPCYPAMTDEQVAYVASTLIEILNAQHL